ncbi:peptide-methionine (S)-S-oxide reductase MsrA [Patescibacteria group bacterium]
MEKTTKNAIFGGGCFACLDPIFSRAKGVTLVTAGYAGGTKKDPTYREVMSGKTGHAQVVKVEYDPSIVTYKELLKLFFSAHDATTLNRQMHDIGTQYRSIILYSDDEQKKIAEEVKKSLGEEVQDTEIVTEIVPLEKFYIAEEAQQSYFQKNPEKSACCSISGSR